jgi:hypothetical protein
LPQDYALLTERDNVDTDEAALSGTITDFEPSPSS